MTEKTKHQILNQTFARRVGKTLSTLKQNLVKNELLKYLFTPEKLNSRKDNKIFLEIGFGMGEHFVHQVKTNPDNLYIGIEVFINGVASALKQIQDCNNFLLWPDDFDLITSKVPANSLAGIYILFPDPWHKKRALKKRLFNQIRLNSLKKMLKPGGFIAFASDIADYFETARSLLSNDQDFTIKNTDFSIPHNGYIQTKYHTKALKEGRSAEFIQAYIVNDPIDLI